ncbi:MAG: DinB family protein [Saprospiraceae bacterium]|nr:DinB family protein [Saprospiraceae bacterium]HRG69506.1 DinB family protein [Saprospiraceae bacterium]
MAFNLNELIEVLKRTPNVLESLLVGLSDSWINTNEGEETWSPYDVMGHYVHAERTNWIQRIEVILHGSGTGTFQSFDRFAQFENSKGKTILELCHEFRELREVNLRLLENMNLQESDFIKTGIHPQFGQVTLSQLLSTWMAHDLDHIYQIVRVMAKQYKADAGPWVEFLRILRA